MNMKRVKLYDLSEIAQVTTIKGLSDRDLDSIKISVYGETPSGDYIEFNYYLEYETEFDRDAVFNEMTAERLKEDIERIVKASNIPIVL